MKLKYDTAIKMLGPNNENLIATQKDIARIEAEIAKIEEASKPSRIPMISQLETIFGSYKRAIIGRDMIDECD